MRAVGFNPEAARYGGISVARNYFLAMAISGSSPGSPARSTSSAGSSRLDATTIQTSNIGFIGIAVALLGRNTAVGTLLGALLFGALVRRARRRDNLDPTVFDPQLASNLTLIIQGLVVLFVGADVLVIGAWQLAPGSSAPRRKAARYQ